MEDQAVRSEKLKLLLAELFGEEHVGAYTASDDLRRVQARVWVDGLPFMYVYELDNATGEYKLRTLNSLGRAKL
jgi:hypothetical protein